MKQRAVAIVADYLSHRPLGRVVGLKPIGDDDYVFAIEDLRDGRVHVARTPRDLEPWLKSFKTGECVQPAFGLCGRCNGIPADHPVGAMTLLDLGRDVLKRRNDAYGDIHIPKQAGDPPAPATNDPDLDF
jgi:hypothetical protein